MYKAKTGTFEEPLRNALREPFKSAAGLIGTEKYCCIKFRPETTCRSTYTRTHTHTHREREREIYIYN